MKVNDSHNLKPISEEVLNSFSELNYPNVIHNSLNYREVILDFHKNSNLNLPRNIFKYFSKELNNSDFIGSPIEILNILSPEITLAQNLSFFCKFYDLKPKVLSHHYDLENGFKDVLNLKRGQMDEALWQAFGLILHFLFKFNFYVISMPIGPALSSIKKNDLLRIINETLQNQSIFFYAHPPAIDNYKNISSNFRVFNENRLSGILTYEQARLSLINHNNKAANEDS